MVILRRRGAREGTVGTVGQRDATKRKGAQLGSQRSGNRRLRTKSTVHPTSCTVRTLASPEIEVGDKLGKEANVADVAETDNRQGAADGHGLEALVRGADDAKRDPECLRGKIG